MPPNGIWHIAVAVEDAPGLGPRAYAGIRQFVGENPEFSVRRFPPQQLALALRSLSVDGLIAQIASPRALRAVRRFRGPIVNISGGLATRYPQCTMDNQAVGAMAAEHLRSRGYRSFAYTYLDWLAFSHDRGKGFRRTVEECGGNCLPIHLPVTRRNIKAAFRLEESIADVLGSLPAATGLFLAAWPGWISIGAVARLARKRIPEDLAVIAVGDDPASCDAEDTPITTVEYVGEKIGYDAAGMLAQLLKSVTPPSPRLIAPTGVTLRASTGTDAIEDPDVALALRLIRARFSLPCTVDALLAEIPVSRSTLDRRFRALLGKSPAEELRGCRRQRAQHLLAQTDLPLAEVARRSGLRRPQHMSAVFRQEMGVTPLEFRQQFQLRRGPE